MPFTLPDAALSQHVAILGKTGSGKSSTAKLAVEQVVADDFRVCILDPIKSDWWGITLAANGKKAGLPFKVLGGPRGHVPLHSSAGKSLGQLVGTGKLPLSVIDMADFEPGGLQRFFSDFAPALLRNARGVVYLVIEEAHEFAPKERAGFGAENLAIHWAKKLATAGRSKGVRLIVATQRVQSLHNAVLGSCETVIAHRLTTPADQEPVLKWLKANTDKDTVEKVSSSLSSLPTGTGWLCSGEAKIFEQVKFPKFWTYDNTATPTGDSDDASAIRPPEVDQDELRSIIGDAVKEAEANDPKLLKAKIAKLEKELVGKPTVAIDPAKLESEYRRGQADERKRWTTGLNGTPKDLVHVGQLIGRATESLRMLCDVKDIPANAVITKTTHATTRPEQNRIIPVTAYRSQTLPGDETLGRGGMRRILTVLAQRPGLTNSQIGVRAGLSSKSGTFSTYLGKLRANGWIRDEGDRRYPTDDGISALGSYDPLPTGQELLSHWVGELGSSGASRMLRVIADAYPNGLTNEQIGEAANVSHLSGTFSTYMGKLRSLELIEGRGTVTASKELFE